GELKLSWLRPLWQVGPPMHCTVSRVIGAVSVISTPSPDHGVVVQKTWSPPISDGVKQGSAVTQRQASGRLGVIAPDWQEAPLIEGFPSSISRAVTVTLGLSWGIRPGPQGANTFTCVTVTVCARATPGRTPESRQPRSSNSWNHGRRVIVHLHSQAS